MRAAERLPPGLFHLVTMGRASVAALLTHYLHGAADDCGSTVLR